MLSINPNPTFTSDVDITIPGQEETGTIKLTFNYMGKSDLISFWDSNKESDFVDVFMKLVSDWSDIDVDFSAENIETFFDNYPAAGKEIFDAYRRLVMESRIKN